MILSGFQQTLFWLTVMVYLFVMSRRINRRLDEIEQLNKKEK